MEILTAIVLGLGTGVFITWFPGMLNMQVVATAVRAGRRPAYYFSGGLATVILGQAALAVLFANLLSDHPGIVPALRVWAVPLFAALGVGFAVKGFRARAARRAHLERPYRGGPFWRGLLMSLTNVLNIPFIGAIAGFLIAHDLLSRNLPARLAFVPTTALGALVIFFLYARLSGWISRHLTYFTRNINFFLAGLFALLTVAQAMRIS